MPELPDVETMRRLLEREAAGRRVAAVEVPDPHELRGLSPSALAGALPGRAFERTYRRGKWLFAEAGAGPWLLLHFRMTGALAFTAPGEPAPRFTRVTFRFAGGSALHLRDQRRLGLVGLVEDPLAFCDENRLGPDALDPALTAAAFAGLLANRRGPLKGVLLNQSVVAGIGNIYGDEICHAAGLAPLSRVEHLSSKEVRAVYRAMRGVLETAVAAEADASRFPRGWLIHDRRPGGVCPRCAGPVARVRYQGRYSYWCPCSQRLA